jgi:3-dehydroquinate synthase
MMVEKTDNLLFTKDVCTALCDQFRAVSFSQVFVLVDNNTRQLCLPLLENILPEHYQTIVIEPGEKNKNLTTCEYIWQSFTDANADRQALLINLGGGVICDMGGFCARTYKRGIAFWNIPTTLLSQVDASVGGKLGVDFGVYKNQLGLFSEPDLVIIDSIFFKTLPHNEVLSGFAEMVKHSLIFDQDMFAELLQQSVSDLDWQNWVARSVAIKKTIVIKDPIEKGLRKILNFGHTIGHAIESYYLDKPASLKHGEAIAIGMICETYLSVTKGMLSQGEGEQIIEYLLKTFPRHLIADEAISSIVAIALQDKKNKDGKIKAVLLRAIGNPAYDVDITEADIRKALGYYSKQLK